MEKIYDIQDFTISSQSISFKIKNERISIPLEKTGSKLMMSAQENQLQIFEIDVDGIGIYWPLIDEDLSISGLLRSANRDDLIVKKIGSIFSEELERKAS
ncbi:MAG: DUF2442 domain-containing protein [SAR324 cluster bacterium]|nr:DUF2442 domain-containing protein [SAR324 cluster bacterium]